MARTPNDGSGGNGFSVDFGDYDNDGDLDLVVANIAHPRYQVWSDGHFWLPFDWGFLGDDAEEDDVFVGVKEFVSIAGL